MSTPGGPQDHDSQELWYTVCPEGWPHARLCKVTLRILDNVGLRRPASWTRCFFMTSTISSGRCLIWKTRMGHACWGRLTQSVFQPHHHWDQNHFIPWFCYQTNILDQVSACTLIHSLLCNRLPLVQNLVVRWRTKTTWRIYTIVVFLIKVTTKTLLFCWVVFETWMSQVRAQWQTWS